MSERPEAVEGGRPPGAMTAPLAAPLPPGLETTAAKQPPQSSRRRRRPLLRLLVGLTFQLALLVPVLLLLVLGTQTGLRVALAVAEDLLPGVFSVEQAEGRVLGRLRLQGVELHLPTLDLSLGRLELEWSPWSLFAGVLAVDQVAVRELDLVVAPGPEEEKAPLALPEVVLPLRVELGEALVERLRVFEPGASEPGFVLERASLSASFQGSELRLNRAEVDLPVPRFSAKAKGHVNLVDNYPLDLALDWELGLPPGARLSGQGQFGGDLQRLGVRHGVTGSVEAELDVHLQDVLGRPSWDGLVKLMQADLPAFQSDLPDLEVAARLETRGDLEEATLTGTLDAKARDLPDFGHLAVALDLLWMEGALAIRTLELTERLSDAALGLTGRLDLGADPLRFSVEGDWERLRWPLSGDLVAESPQGDLTASGTLDAFDYRLSTQALGPGFPRAGLVLGGRGRVEGARIETLELETLGGRLQGQGDLAWSPTLGWDLELRGRDLNPGDFIEGLEDRVTLSLFSQGGLDGFDYDLAASSVGPGLPAGSLTLVGIGDTSALELETLRLEMLDGRIEGQGRVGLAPQVTWEASLAVSGVDPGVYAPDWPGRIDGRLVSQGTLEEAGPRLTAAIEELSGELRGYPIAASGRLEMAGESVLIQGLTAASGPSEARVNGRIDESLELAFDLSSPDLASLLPEGRGSLEARGKVLGSLAAPRVTLDLSARDAELAGQGIATLSGKVDLDLAPAGPFRIQLDGKGLFAGGMHWSELRARGEGSMPDHSLTLSLTGEQLSLNLAASGALAAGGAYDGRLSSLQLESAALGAWRLQRPAGLSLDQSRISAGPFCLRHEQGSGGCLEFDQATAGEWTAEMDLDQLGMDLVAGLFPENLVAEGGGRIKGRFEAAGGILSGSATAEIPRGQIRVALGQEKSESLDFSNTRLNLDAGSRGLSARLALPVRDLGEIEGDLSLPGWRLDDPGRPGQPLRGAFKAEVQGLSRISNLLPDISGLRGALDADLTLGGTLAAPGVKGEVRARDFGFEVPLIGLQVQDLNLSAVAPSSERFTLRGEGTVGGGRLDLSGEGGIGGDGFSARFQAAGERLKVADTKEYFAIVSPRFDLEATAKGARIRGEIQVPEARIRPRSVPAGTVSPSSDVVLEEKEAKPPYPVEIDIRVSLGDEVTIDAFGVRGRLTGNLAVLQPPGKDMLGDGQLQILDGQYRLSGGRVAAELGTPLTITQGRLIYAKSLIGNPGLLLQAEREGGSTTAGVRVLGTLRDPKLAFFSESDPDMTQAEITKYLLTGVPPASNDRAQDAGLAVGTYVAPKVYMEYESGLGDEPNKVRLRYDLSHRIELQTETGESQGADIFFKFEH